MALVEAPEIRVVIVSHLSLMSLALFEQHGAVRFQSSVDCCQPLLWLSICTPRQKDFVQPANQAIRPLLMLQAVHRKCLPAMPVRAHHALDEHFCEIVEDTRVM